MQLPKPWNGLGKKLELKICENGSGNGCSLEQKNQIDNLVKSVELKPRIGTGLYGMAKRRAERHAENPLPARRGGFLRQQKRDVSK